MQVLFGKILDLSLNIPAVMSKLLQKSKYLSNSHSGKNSSEDLSASCIDSAEKWQFHRKRDLLYLENSL